MVSYSLCHYVVYVVERTSLRPSFPLAITSPPAAPIVDHPAGAGEGAFI